MLHASCVCDCFSHAFRVHPDCVQISCILNLHISLYIYSKFSEFFVYCYFYMNCYIFQFIDKLCIPPLSWFLQWPIQHWMACCLPTISFVYFLHFPLLVLYSFIQLWSHGMEGAISVWSTMAFNIFFGFLFAVMTCQFVRTGL